ncbi:MAG TPA: Gfo/Idh/MocA family oxidoreductase, partial [Bryobacterales bacterium]|nr:Gfo/Idh/MocA family oxidoreductase [Bryobacterales bacterium]
DVVAVCVPPRFHAEIALAALDAGKHVFVEKPLALSLEECDRLVERSARAPQKAMVGFNLRWHRLLRRARERIAQGALGPIELIRTAFTMRPPADVSEWRKRRETGGGVLAELAVHHFDLWRYLTGSEVEEVFAASRSGLWEDETAIVTARMAGGPLASAIFSERTSNTNDVEIYGRDGSLRVSCYRSDSFELLPAGSTPGSVRTRLRRLAGTLQGLPRAALEARQGGGFRSTYQAEWRHFLDAILHDGPVNSTFHDGRCAQQVLLAATASVLQGRPVKVA